MSFLLIMHIDFDGATEVKHEMYPDEDALDAGLRAWQKIRNVVVWRAFEMGKEVKKIGVDYASRT